MTRATEPGRTARTVRTARTANATVRGLAAPLLALCLGAGLASFAAVGPAAAERDCAVPLGDWQPRAALQKKLEAEGWTVFSIRIDDGCYKVKAMNAQGARLKAKYDPARLEPVEEEHGDDD